MPSKKSIPNLLTATRLALLPVLWVLALRGMDVLLGAGIVLAWITDVLDGFAARRLRAESAWGSRLDSIADTLLMLSAAGWLVMLRPEFIRENAVPLLVWAAIGAAAYLVGWLRFRRVADLHLYSGKAANFCGFLFAAYLLAFRGYPRALFYVVIAVCIVAALEMLLAFATLERVDRRMTTILEAWRGRGPQQSRSRP